MTHRAHRWRTEAHPDKGTSITRGSINGAGKGTRTLDPDLGKVVLYQLSYSRPGNLHVAHRWNLGNTKIAPENGVP